MAPMHTSPSRIKTFASCAFALCLVVSGILAGGAGAVNLEKAQNGLKAAEKRAEVLGKEISRAKGRVSDLTATVAGLEGEISIAQAEYDKLQLRLQETVEELQVTQGRYDSVRAEMNYRAAESYMEGGPATSLDFLLSAESMADLTVRVEFISALQASDAERASTLTNLARHLNETRKRQASLTKFSRDALLVLQDKHQTLNERESELRSELSSLQSQLAEAKRLEAKWKHKVQVYWKSVGGNGGASPFTVCPVPQYTWISDGFGDVRYTTIPPHPHQGNDIGAAYGSPIVAPFNGVASDASNGLGGLSVYVKNSSGYVYNAHLSRMGQLGPVNAGDIIGYVGMSGDAQGTVPHNHFEWHPNGGAAVDPYAALMAVC